MRRQAKTLEDLDLFLDFVEELEWAVEFNRDITLPPDSCKHLLTLLEKLRGTSPKKSTS